MSKKIKTNEGKILKVGAIILKKYGGSVYILLVYRKKEDDWSFPKGHVEAKESIKEAVTREVKEETGINSEIVRELFPNVYLNSRTSEETVTRMHLLRPTSFKLKPEFDGDKVEWVLFEKAKDRLSYDNLKDYFEKVSKELNIKFFK